MKRQEKGRVARDGVAPPIKNGRRERRPGDRRHKAGTAYGCFVSDLTRFAADPCIGPGRPTRRPLCESYYMPTPSRWEAPFILCRPDARTTNRSRHGGGHLLGGVG